MPPHRGCGRVPRAGRRVRRGPGVGAAPARSPSRLRTPPRAFVAVQGLRVRGVAPVGPDFQRPELVEGEGPGRGHGPVPAHCGRARRRDPRDHHDRRPGEPTSSAHWAALPGVVYEQEGRAVTHGAPSAAAGPGPPLVRRRISRRGCVTSVTSPSGHRSHLQLPGGFRVSDRAASSRSADVTPPRSEGGVAGSQRGRNPVKHPHSALIPAPRTLSHPHARGPTTARFPRSLQPRASGARHKTTEAVRDRSTYQGLT